MTHSHALTGKDRARSFWCLLFNAAFFVLCVVVLVPHSINNDDLIIHVLTDGAYGSETPFLIHTNVFFARLLVLLQSAAPAVNWFAVIELLLVFSAFTLVGCEVWRRNPGFSGFALMASMTVLAQPYFINELHNSKLTPLVAAAGLVAVFFGLDRKSILITSVGAVTAIIASFIRFHAFGLGATFAFAWGLGTVLDLDGVRTVSDWFRKNMKYIVTFGAIFLVVFGFYFADIASCEADVDAAQYREYNLWRGQISDFDFPEYDLLADKYEELSLSRNDLRMISEWSFGDLSDFSPERVRIIAVALRAENEHTAAKYFENLKEDLFSNPHFIVCAAVFVLVMIFANNLKSRTIAAFAMMALLGCHFYMSSVGRTTRWVTAGIVGGLLLVLFLCFENFGKRFGPKVSAGVLSALLILSLAVGVVFYGGEIESWDSAFYTSLNGVYHELKEDDDTLYLFDVSTMPELEKTTPIFSSVERGLFKNIYFLGGWDTDSAPKNAVLSSFGIDGGNVYGALAERQDVFLVDTKCYETKLAYMREHYGEDIGFSFVRNVEGYFVFACAQRVKAESETGFSVVDFARSPSEVVPGFTYVGAVVNRELEPGSLAYVELSTEGGVTRCYRAEPLEPENGRTGLTLAVPNGDVDMNAGVIVRVIVKNGSQAAATESFSAES